jgi:hypothetical protein
MANKNIKYFCFGCFTGAFFFYLKVDSDLHKKNQIIKNDLEILKKYQSKDEQKNVTVNKEENEPIIKENGIQNYLSTSFKSILLTNNPNDLIIFKFIFRTYFPEGVLTLILKALDFNKRKV